jgi:hypothetical protein
MTALYDGAVGFYSSVTFALLRKTLVQEQQGSGWPAHQLHPEDLPGHLLPDKYRHETGELLRHLAGDGHRTTKPTGENYGRIRNDRTLDDKENTSGEPVRASEGFKWLIASKLWVGTLLRPSRLLWLYFAASLTSPIVLWPQPQQRV